VLCTTATANDRVVTDVSEQLRVGARGDQLTVYRGALGRTSLRLEVATLPEPAARLAWLATWLPRLPGSGIVYCLTKRDTETVAGWLNGEGISALGYSGEVADEERVEAERRLLANDVKAVVATSALGMGYDKPDLGFVVHYQAPSSAIAYYQQVGRAGRGVEEAHVVLLRGAEDRRIQDFFIETAFPARALVERVRELLPATLAELQADVNLGRGRLEGLLKVLDVEGAVRRDGTRWAPTGAPWEYEQARYEQVTALRRAEQEAMFRYGADGRCLMLALLDELDDPAAAPCGRCSVCASPRFDAPLDEALVRRARRHLRSRPAVLSVRRQTPRTADQPGKRIPLELQLEEGRALSRAGDGAWDELVAAGRRAGRFDDELVAACADAVRRWRPHPQPAWVAAVPSLRTSDLVPDLGRRIAAALDLPYVDALERVADGPPQREMENSAQQVANVRGKFRVATPPPPRPGLLLDDVRYSGWTLATVGAQLRHGSRLSVSLTGTR
jgi:ATP-dependent DNA helicase RecQ